MYEIERFSESRFQIAVVDLAMSESAIRSVLNLLRRTNGGLGGSSWVEWGKCRWQ